MTRVSTIAAAAAIALLLAGCGDRGGESNQAAASAAPAALKQIPAPNGDWTQVVSETPEGGFRMGNPDAPVKLVEYASLTCPFCQRFAEEGVPTLRDTYVKSGQVSWEYRTFINHPTDPGVSLLLHCEGAAPFFTLAEQIYATQREWSGKVETAPPATLAEIQKLPPAQGSAALMKLAGLDAFFRQRGMPQARIDACLADPAGMRKLTQIVERGQKDGLEGTPGFLINGRYLTGVSDWKGLEPQLRAALR